MDGIFNIYKEKGFTSHDVVAIVRRTIHMKKVGHTGTLDPDAEGVLPVCVGKATKLSDVIMDGSTHLDHLFRRQQVAQPSVHSDLVESEKISSVRTRKLK